MIWMEGRSPCKSGTPRDRNSMTPSQLRTSAPLWSVCGGACACNGPYALGSGEYITCVYMLWQGYILTYDITNEQTFATGVLRWRKLLAEVGMDVCVYVCVHVCVCACMCVCVCVCARVHS